MPVKPQEDFTFWTCGISSPCVRFSHARKRLSGPSPERLLAAPVSIVSPWIFCSETLNTSRKKTPVNLDRRRTVSDREPGASSKNSFTRRREVSRGMLGASSKDSSTVTRRSERPSGAASRRSW